MGARIRDPPVHGVVGSLIMRSAPFLSLWKGLGIRDICWCRVWVDKKMVQVRVVP
jgi:hypothetical protein